MKKILIAALLLISVSLSAQDADSKYKSKVQTLDGTIETLYGVISGEAGEPRDWDLFRYLFVENAWLIPSGKDTTGTVRYRHMKPEDYVKNSGPCSKKTDLWRRNYIVSLRRSET